MKRTFKNGLITVNKKQYKTIVPYDLSILEGEQVEISPTIGGQHRYCYLPTNEQMKLLGTKARFIILTHTRG